MGRVPALWPAPVFSEAFQLTLCTDLDSILTQSDMQKLGSRGAGCPASACAGRERARGLWLRLRAFPCQAAHQCLRWAIPLTSRSVQAVGPPLRQRVSSG